MRFARSSVVAGAALAAYGAATAALSARQLADLPTRGAIRPDPLASTLGAAGLVVSIAAYALLGRHLARGAATERDAVTSGAAAGLIAGAIGGTLSALAVQGYLSAAFAGYGTAGAQLVDIVLGGYVVLWTAASAAAGAVMTWLAYRALRRRTASG